MAGIQKEFKEIKEKQDEYVNSLLSFNYNLEDFDEEVLDIGFFYLIKS